MAAHRPAIPAATLLLLLWASLGAPVRAQAPAAPTEKPTPATQKPAAPAAEKPLPDIPTLMRAVETNQRAAEAIEKDYLYHSTVTEQHTDSNGQVKQTEITEFDHFWIDGVPEARMVSKDGKPLTPDQLAKEDSRIDKEAAKARERRQKEDAEGKETDPRGDEEITVSRLLELGSFTNPRRVLLNGRATIAVDYAGDPKAKTRNRAEDIVRDLVGTAWIDEQDRVLARAQGRFVNAFKIGAGLIASIQKDTSFAMQQTKVNGEVWLPASIDAHGAARFLLFFNFSGNVHAVESDYRKFRTSSTILPAVTGQNQPQPAAPPQP